MKKNTIKKVDKGIASIITEADMLRAAEARKAEAEARFVAEMEAEAAFEAETERLQMLENIRRAAEAQKPKTNKEERFCKTRSPNKELQQLLAIQRHQSQLAAWEHRRQKYGDSGYKAGHSPLHNRAKKAATS
jgi:hypothetical protein